VLRVGVEVGGTFTDLIAVDDDGNVAATGKVFSTPSDPSDGVLAALHLLEAGQRAGAPLIHGSTVATNAIIERRGARVGLLVTAGFGDLLELQRQDRDSIYELHYRKPDPLVPRDLVREVPERLIASGEVLQPLDEAATREAARALLDVGVTSIAVCLLHAYKNPVHERRARDIVMEMAPEAHVSLSSDVIAEFREYERASTATIDAFVKPVVDRYLAHLEAEAGALGISGIWMMQSNGGILPSSYARDHPVHTLYSGPAAGVTGALTVARAAGIDDIITLDMGGTSTDVCLVTGGQPEITAESAIDRIPLKMPMIDIVSVGAGGGSIAWLDSGGMLQVGPRSAGASPGPVSYGLGGTEPTTTDANVARGLIRPEHFLGGRHQLDRAAAEKALATLAEASGLDNRRLPEDIYRIACATMSGAIRVVSVERGYDPRGYTLVAYGGAGPLHAAIVAEDLNIDHVLVPPYPGLMSAYGLLAGDFQRDFARTDVASLPALDLAAVRERFSRLQAGAREQLAAQDIDPDSAEAIMGLDMRYRGQGFELTVPITAADLDGARRDGLAEIEARFHELHRQRYGHSTPGEEVEAVTYRVSMIVPYPKPRTLRSPEEERAQHETLPVVIDGVPADCAFYWRASLRLGDAFSGPAVIEEPTATTFVPPSWRLRVDEQTNLRLERSA
jgi:N-methylhydantoinase A